MNKNGTVLTKEDMQATAIKKRNAHDNDFAFISIGKKEIEAFGSNGWTTVYRYPEEMNRHYVNTLIMADDGVFKYVPRKFLVDILMDTADQNALSVCEGIMLVNPNEDGISMVRDKVEDIYGDEYAQFVAEDECGCCWLERNIVVINVGEILDLAYGENCTENEIREEILTTMFHELRHLVLEKNKLISRYSKAYSFINKSEKKVEDYGRSMAQVCMKTYKEQRAGMWKRTKLA